MTIEARKVELHERFVYLGLPDYMWGGVSRHVFEGRPTGGFLSALFEGDLFTAALAADDTNFPLLGLYVRLLVWWGPRDCYGSPEKVKRWLAHGGLAGLEVEAEPDSDESLGLTSGRRGYTG